MILMNCTDCHSTFLVMCRDCGLVFCDSCKMQPDNCMDCGSDRLLDQ